jgi:hypothetical protein
MIYSADQVWGLAVRADLHNGGYYKLSDHTDTGEITANKILLKKWLMENIEPTQEEIELGQSYRKHFNCYLLTVMKRSLSSFEQMVVKVYNMDQFSGAHATEISVVSCLPKIARDEQVSDQLNRELLYTSAITGRCGDPVGGTLQVTKVDWSRMYEKYIVGGWIDSYYITFFTAQKFQVNERIVITGKIKKHKPDNSTQLNYVKRKG